MAEKTKNKGHKNVIPFVKGDPRINRKGRPRSMNTILKQYFADEHNLKLTKSQTQELISGILTKTRKELVQLAKDDKLPFWISMIAKKAVSDYKNGSIELVEKLWDRVHGRPAQEIKNDVTVNNASDDQLINDLQNVPLDEIRALIEKYADAGNSESTD